MENSNHIVIVKFLKGEASASEMELLAQWISESNENAQEYKKIEELWNASQIVANRQTFNYEKAFDRFKFSIQQSYHKHQSNPRVLYYVNLTLRVAAVALILLGISAALKYIIFTKNESSVETCEITTDYGAKTTFKLADGTTITLNAKSKLRYPSVFSDKSRVVYLEGEAFFDVAKEKNRPFIVKTSDIDIRVLGTTFNVKSYPEEGAIETTLLTGAIKIEQKTINNKLLVTDLKPNQRATYIKGAGKLLLTNKEELLLSTKKEELNSYQKEKILLIGKVDTEIFTTWKDNKLIFDNESFESISTKLERRYGVKITFKSEELKLIRFSGTFTDMPLEQAMKALQFASQFHFSIDKTQIIITK